MARILADHDESVLKEEGLEWTIAERLSGLGSLHVWRMGDSLSPGIFVESFLGALYVLLFLSLEDPISIAVCGWCNKRFTRTKTTQAFCSLRCGNNARKARQRLKEGGGTNVTRKAR
jgi:hypothetical protein